MAASIGKCTRNTDGAERIEAIKVDVVKKPAGDDRKLKVLVHQQDEGWKGWTDEGYATGTDGMGIRLEAIKMVLQ